MNRSIWYSQEQWRSFDIVAFEHDVLTALGASIQDIFGQTTTVIGGMAATPTGPATLTINIAGGRVYQRAQADAVAVGAIPQDTTVIEQQGVYAGGTVVLVPPTLSSHSQWNLIQAQFSQTDIVRSGDPNGGVPPFYNAANPSQPLNGQGGLGATSPTEREGLCIIQVIQGVSATTGSETPPNPTSGWVPLYLVDLANGQTQITSGAIFVAGPSVGTNVPNNYPYAPFLAGLLSSHHSGNPGQAPQIILTSEVQGILPIANGGAQGLGVAGDSRRLLGSAAGGTKTASWTADRLIAQVTLAGLSYPGTSLSLSFNGAGTGANGMDTGSMPTSADLSIYAIYNPATNTWATLGVAGATSHGTIYSGTHMPAGYTASALLWTGVTDSSSNIQGCYQAGRQIWVGNLSVLISGTATSYTPISISAFVPANAISAGGNATTFSGADFQIVGQISGSIGYQTTQGGTGDLGPIPLVTPQTLYYFVSTGSASMSINSYSF